MESEEIKQLALIIAEKSVIPGTPGAANRVIEAYTNAIKLLESENEKIPAFTRPKIILTIFSV